MNKNHLILLFPFIFVAFSCDTNSSQEEDANLPQTSTSAQSCNQTSECPTGYYCINNICINDEGPGSGQPSLPFSCEEGEEQIVTKGDNEPEICHCGKNNDIICPSDEVKEEPQPEGTVPTLPK